MMNERARLLGDLDRLDAPCTFWWRDDDAGRPSPRLDRLLSSAERLAVPLALVWAALGLWLGRTQQRIVRKTPPAR